MELASYYPSDTHNFKAVPRFLENLCSHAVHNTTFDQISLIAVYEGMQCSTTVTILAWRSPHWVWNLVCQYI